MGSLVLHCLNARECRSLLPLKAFARTRTEAKTCGQTRAVCRVTHSTLELLRSAPITFRWLAGPLVVIASRSPGMSTRNSASFRGAEFPFVRVETAIYANAVSPAFLHKRTLLVLCTINCGCYVYVVNYAALHYSLLAKQQTVKSRLT